MNEFPNNSDQNVQFDNEDDYEEEETIIVLKFSDFDGTQFLNNKTLQISQLLNQTPHCATGDYTFEGKYTANLGTQLLFAKSENSAISQLNGEIDLSQTSSNLAVSGNSTQTSSGTNNNNTITGYSGETSNQSYLIGNSITNIQFELRKVES